MGFEPIRSCELRFLRPRCSDFGWALQSRFDLTKCVRVRQAATDCDRLMGTELGTRSDILEPCRERGGAATTKDR